MKSQKYRSAIHVLTWMILITLTVNGKLEAMNQTHSNPFKPTSKKVLDESELKKLAIVIVKEIEKLKSRYLHLKNFELESARFRPSLIWYKNNIQTRPNPEYEKEILKRKENRPVKRPLPPEEIQVFPRKDGIELYIEFIRFEEFQMSQRMRLPELWIGNYAVELKIDGADTGEIREIREKVNQILTMVKKMAEK